MNNDPTPESAPQMHAAANESIEAMFRKGCDLERQLAKVTEQRDMLADLLRKSCAAHPVAGDWLEKSQEALADVKGGQHE